LSGTRQRMALGKEKLSWRLLTVDKYHFLTVNIAWKRTKQ
jgi:hypothetical protein